MRPGVLLSLLYCGAAFGGAFLFMRWRPPRCPRSASRSGGSRSRRWSCCRSPAAPALTPSGPTGALRDRGPVHGRHPVHAVRVRRAVDLGGYGLDHQRHHAAVDGDHPGCLAPTGAHETPRRGDPGRVRGGGVIVGIEGIALSPTQHLGSRPRSLARRRTGSR